MILDVVCCYLLLFLLYVNIKIGKKKMLNARLPGDHLYGKSLFTGDIFDGVFFLFFFFLFFFLLSLFPRDVLDEI